MKCWSGIQHRSWHSQFQGWRKVVPVCGVLNVSNPYSTGNPWSKKNNQGVHELGCFPIGEQMVDVCTEWSCSAKMCLMVFPNYCCPERWFGLNWISHPDWVKLCIELNYKPNQNYENFFCYRFFKQNWAM